MSTSFQKQRKKFLVSVSQAASILNKTRQQVNLDIRLGKLPAQKVGKAYVLLLSDVEKFQNKPS
jgi:hypothetical protein